MLVKVVVKNGWHPTWNMKPVEWLYTSSSRRTTAERMAIGRCLVGGIGCSSGTCRVLVILTEASEWVAIIIFSVISLLVYNTVKLLIEYLGLLL